MGLHGEFGHSSSQGGIGKGAKEVVVMAQGQHAYVKDRKGSSGKKKKDTKSM